jgi:hypothetical protein
MKLHKDILKRSNKKGIEFMKAWNLGCKKVIDGDSNWFFVIDYNGKVYSIPYAHTGCSPTFFGDTRHYARTMTETMIRRYHRGITGIWEKTTMHTVDSLMKHYLNMCN